MECPESRGASHAKAVSRDACHRSPKDAKANRLVIRQFLGRVSLGWKGVGADDDPVVASALVGDGPLRRCWRACQIPEQQSGNHGDPTEMLLPALAAHQSASGIVAGSFAGSDSSFLNGASKTAKRVSLPPVRWTANLEMPAF